ALYGCAPTCSEVGETPTIAPRAVILRSAVALAPVALNDSESPKPFGATEAVAGMAAGVTLTFVELPPCNVPCSGATTNGEPEPLPSDALQTSGACPELTS